ncbi:MAG: cation transporter [Pseudomonadales bacterium]|nr:cation transporter [Pseudomonadales bacterium]
MADACCGGDVAATDKRHRKVLLVVLGINVLAFLLMTTGSWLSGSSSLLSGMLDNFGDAVTYALSFAVVGAASQTKARVALFKGFLILGAAVAVAVHIAWRLSNLHAPVVDVMLVTAVLNLAANGVCFWMLTPLRHDDVNMASVWECSRNDLFEGGAVIVTSGLVWITQSGWPDVLVAALLLFIFLRSAIRVLRSAWQEMGTPAY